MNPIKFLKISQITWLIAAIFCLITVVWIQIQTPSNTAWFFILAFVVSALMYMWRTYQLKKLKNKNER